MVPRVVIARGVGARPRLPLPREASVRLVGSARLSAFAFASDGDADEVDPRSN